MENANGSGHPVRKKKSRVKTVLQVIGTVVLIGAVTTAMLACIFAVYVKTCITPKLDINLDDFKLDQTTVIYYTNPDTGEPVELQSLYKEENRIWTDYDQMPIYLEKAAVAIEDKRFYTHHGVDWYRTFWASINMFLQMKDNFGGSTITQQVIKNLTNEDEVTVKRKITEIFRALEFERNYSKEEIMEIYLNTIYLGEGCSGVYTAAYTYFGKNVSDLTIAECACLIGITNNPSLYDPYISVERNKARQETILYQMYDQGMITEDQYQEAMAQELVFQRGSDGKKVTHIYSYFVDQVIADVIADLMEEKGISYQAASTLVYSAGYKIYCTMNPNIQEDVDNVYTNLENIPYTSASGQQLQSAITIIDPKSGNIVAMAGGVGEKTGSRVLNRAESARPPGSSIKPISVYAPALDSGVITPTSVIDDTPVMLVNNNPWPKNSDGEYGGLTTVKEALRESNNVVAVKVLQMLTPQASYKFMTEKMGITTLVDQKVVGDKTYTDIDLAPLGLGGLTVGINTVEMAAAYATFANEGIYTQPRTYTKVLDASGQTVLSKDTKSSVALKEKTAYYINNLLKNVVAAGTGTSAKFSGMTIAGKTGTTTNNYDRWFVGYTPYYVAAVWTGYDISEKIKVSGNPAAVLWKKVMSQVHEGLENKDFSKPSGVVSVTYCMDSGKLATSLCKEDPRGDRTDTAYVLPEDMPTESCDVHVAVKICTDSGCIAGEYCPADKVKEAAYLDITRELVAPDVVIQDTQYTLEYILGLGSCPVHTAPPVTEPPVTEPTEPGVSEEPGGEATVPPADSPVPETPSPALPGT
ncbi:transglycosylase domain-containing protein [Papillibacter cinnamivorans]|uniref:Penicillin-binding protein 1A n=1 Tax=Papillibacter cinnamivorans DSM 12816 TaxID=1122930 RepID=A0A1W1Z163_9FIRM|nr:PBP1A family penicillin-binding protein [Papillibacter cinnamivorans]SMC42136.1 penicillin-binding protein 1A [Papillibacter cinnamivorans DSM 12816]